MHLTVDQIAKICHEANRLYCEMMGHPPILPWSHAPEWQTTSAINGVTHAMANPMVTPEDMHANWAAEKSIDGWVHGPVKDASKKEHPCLVPYDELPADQRAKDSLFLNVVRALEPVTKTPEVLAEEKAEAAAEERERRAAARRPVEPTTRSPVISAYIAGYQVALGTQNCVGATTAQNRADLANANYEGNQQSQNYVEPSDDQVRPNDPGKQDYPVGGLPAGATEETSHVEEHSEDVEGNPTAQADCDGGTPAGQEGSGTEVEAVKP